VPSKEIADAVAFWANVATPIALLIGAVQLFYGRRASSGGALIALMESFRQAWLQFSNAPHEGAKQHTFSDVMNLLNMSCAIFEDTLFIGRSGRLLEFYLFHVFGLIEHSDDAKKRIQRMIMTEKTFEHIVKFIERHRDEIKGFKLPSEEPIQQSG